MADWLHRAQENPGYRFPPYALGGLVLLVLYIIQAELRFGAAARTLNIGSGRWCRS